MLKKCLFAIHDCLIGRSANWDSSQNDDWVIRTANFAWHPRSSLNNQFYQDSKILWTGFLNSKIADQTRSSFPDQTELSSLKSITFKATVLWQYLLTNSTVFSRILKVSSLNHRWWCSEKIHFAKIPILHIFSKIFYQKSSFFRTEVLVISVIEIKNNSINVVFKENLSSWWWTGVMVQPGVKPRINRIIMVNHPNRLLPEFCTVNNFAAYYRS